MAGSKRGGRAVTGGRGGRSSDRIAPSTRSHSDPSLSMEPEDGASRTMEPEPEVDPSEAVHTSSASIGSASNNADSREVQKCGITSRLGARRAMKSAKARLTVDFNFSLMTTICDSTEAFNNEIGYLVRKNCSFRYKDWRLVPEEVRALIRHKLLTLFDFDIEEEQVRKFIDKQMNRAWKGQKYKFHSHFKRCWRRGRSN